MSTFHLIFFPTFLLSFFFFNDPQRSYDDKTRVLHIRNNSIRVQSETVSIIIAHAELEFGHKTYLRPKFFCQPQPKSVHGLRIRFKDMSRLGSPSSRFHCARAEGSNFNLPKIWRKLRISNFCFTGFHIKILFNPQTKYLPFSKSQ